MTSSPDTLSYFIKRELIARYKKLITEVTKELNSGNLVPRDLDGKLEALVVAIKAKTPVEAEEVTLPIKSKRKTKG